MRRRDFIKWIAGSTAAWPLAARAQLAGKLPTIGFLGSTSPAAQSQWTAAFVQRLRELGWTEGRNVAIEYRWAEGRPERAAKIAAEFARLKVDIIVVQGTPATIAAKQTTAVIPIISAAMADPVRTGLVASLAHVVIDPLVNANRIRINTLALAARLPTMHGNRENVEAGGLMSYGTNYPDLFRRSADLVDKILRGTKPADIPVERSTKFDLVINLTTAKALGLNLPEAFLLRANEVIE
jgi:ABC-type uncharacterized transport system substrate-binding protein